MIKLTAIQTLKLELLRVQMAMSELVNDSGIVYAGNKYRYQLLVKEASQIKGSIEWFVKLKQA